MWKFERLRDLSNMEPHDDWHSVEAADEHLRQGEYKTFELLTQLKATLKRLLMQKSPFTRLDTPKSLQDKIRWPNSLVALDGQLLRNLRAEIGALEDLLAERYDSAELGQYGTINQHLGRRSFYRGFLDKRRSVPLLQRSSPDVIRFLEKVPKFGEYLKRENHAHFGIHYHYLDSNKKRSDTVLCFSPPSPWPFEPPPN